MVKVKKGAKHYPKTIRPTPVTKVKTQSDDEKLNELLSKAQEHIDTFHYDEAQEVCKEALSLKPDNVKALEISGSLCLELGNTVGARHCYGRAISLSPHVGYSKYLSMAQLLSGKDSLVCYEKAISLMKESIENVKPSGKSSYDKNKTPNKQKGKKNKQDESSASHFSESDPSSSLAGAEAMANSSSTLNMKVSNAYCSIGEIFMTDLCDEEEAEIKCLNNIKKAIEADNTNPEAYLQMASYKLVLQKFDEAKENIKKSLSFWFEKYQKVLHGKAEPGSFDPVEVCPLSHSTRISTVKVLIEVEDHKTAEEILEGLLTEDDEVIEVWYLMGWNFYLQGEQSYVAAKENLEKAIKLHEQMSTEDIQLIEHCKELLQELQYVKNDDDAEDNSDDSQWEDVDDSENNEEYDSDDDGDIINSDSDKENEDVEMVES